MAYSQRAFQISIAGIPFAIEFSSRANARIYRKLKSAFEGFICVRKKPRHCLKIFYKKRGLALDLQGKNLEIFISRQVIENKMLWNVFWDKLILFLSDTVLAYPDIVLLHAAACVKAHKGYLFLGPSKSGKTTVARLSRDHLVFADDKILVKRRGKKFSLFPLPLLSYEKRKLPGNLMPPSRVEKILFLKKAQRVSFKKTSKAYALAQLFERVKDLNRLAKLDINKVADMLYQMAQLLPAFTMYFRKDSSFWRHL
jgi:hypothetical protein